MGGVCRGRATVLGGGHAESRLEGAVERSDRPVADLERDRENRYPALGGITQPGAGVAQPMRMQEIIVVAESQGPVDHPAQDVLLCAEHFRQRGDSESFARVQLLGDEAACEPVEHAAFAAPRQAFWDLSREVWDSVLTGREPFVETAPPGQPPRFVKMFEVEEAFLGRDLSDPAVRDAARERILAVIREYRAP